MLILYDVIILANEFIYEHYTREMLPYILPKYMNYSLYAATVFLIKHIVYDI